VAGIDGFIIAVEVDISYGLPVFNIVGLWKYLRQGFTAF